MKKIILIVFIFCIFLNTKSQEVKIYQSFENLTEIKIPKINENSIKYDPSISEVVAKQYKDLDAELKNRIFPYEADGCDANAWVMLKTKINRNTDKYYYIIFNTCPSDWNYDIYEEGNRTPIDRGDLYAKNIIIPGNGSIYTSGHIGNFDVRRKFELTNNKIVEVKQPYYYIGLKSRTLNTVNIYQTKDCKTLIATLPKDYEIEILLTEDPFQPSIYLVRTSFGLTGWAKLKAGQYKSMDVEGLFYNND